MIYIMDSMTTKELECDGRIFIKEPSRIVRVARGSGCAVVEVEMILQQHRNDVNYGQICHGCTRWSTRPTRKPNGQQSTNAKNDATGSIKPKFYATSHEYVRRRRWRCWWRWGLAGMMNNPAMMQQAQQMMRLNPQMMQQAQQMMKNPGMMQKMMQQFGGMGGMGGM